MRSDDDRPVRRDVAAGDHRAREAHRRAPAAAGHAAPVVDHRDRRARHRATPASALEHARRAEQALGDDHEVAGAGVDEQRLGVGRSVGYLSSMASTSVERHARVRRGLARLGHPVHGDRWAGRRRCRRCPRRRGQSSEPSGAGPDRHVLPVDRGRLLRPGTRRAPCRPRRSRRARPRRPSRCGPTARPSDRGDAASPDSSTSRGSVTVPAELDRLEVRRTGSHRPDAAGVTSGGRQRHEPRCPPTSVASAATLRRTRRHGARRHGQDGPMAEERAQHRGGDRVPRRAPRRPRSPTSCACTAATGRAPTPTAPRVASWWCASAQLRDGYEMDEAAAAWAGPDLPIPEVLAVGDAFGGAFAISVRHHGQFLEDVGVDDAAGRRARRSSGCCARSAPCRRRRTLPPTWYPPGEDPATSTWRRWLLDSLVDDPDPHGERVASDPGRRSRASTTSTVAARSGSASSSTRAPSGATSSTATCCTRTCS